MQEVACFSKWKAPSPGAALGPDYEEEIAKSHVLPPLESYSFKTFGKSLDEQTWRWSCVVGGMNITFKEKLPKAAGEPASVSVPT